MPQHQAKIPILLTLLAFLLAACKFVEVVESLPPIQPTETASPAPPTFTPFPTETSTLVPTATLYRGMQNPANGHWYLLLSQERSWRTAHEYCRGMGAHLVTISDESENQFVFGISSQVWLGASDEEQEGVWKWITGEPMIYTNWAEPEPNNCAEPNCQPGHFAVFFENTPQWVVVEQRQDNDTPALELPFICEWDE